MRDTINDIISFYERNETAVNVVAVVLAIGIVHRIGVKKAYEEGYCNAIVDILDKNEGKVINF